MDNSEVTKEQLFQEVEKLRHKISELEREVTINEQARENLQESEENLRVTLHSIGDAVIVTDIQRRITRMNPVAERLTGWSFSGAKDKPIQEVFNIVNVKTGKSPKDPVKQTFNRGSIVGLANHTKLISKNGMEYQISDAAAPIRKRDGTIIGAVLIFRDVTDDYRMREALRASEEKYRTFFENTGTANCILEENGTISLANQEFANLSGYSLEEIQNKKTWMEFVAEEDLQYMREQHELRRENRLKALREYEFRFVNRFENLKYIHLFIDLIPGTKKSTASLMDITERKKTEMSLRKAKEQAEESDRLKSAFLANMSHEIRTPMNGIMGFTELLSSRNLQSKTRQEYIRIIQNSGRRMMETVNDLVEISKIETGQVEINIRPTDIKHHMESNFHLYLPQAQEKGLKIKLHELCAGMDKKIETDPVKLDSILSNLLKNAIKYTDDGSIEMGCKPEGKQIKFYVQDTGIGVPADRHQDIFKRFVQADIEDTRAFEGSGLGLSISKAYVEMLGGKIWLESEEGKGSCFCFTLPASDDEKKTEDKPKSKEKINKFAMRDKVKILIAEDDNASFLLLQNYLKDTNWQIIRCITGKEVLEVLRKQEDIDLVLMDIKMPEMDGYETTQKIREFNMKVPIIAQTAHALMGIKEKALEAGCNDYVSKPLQKDVLMEKIALVLQ